MKKIIFCLLCLCFLGSKLWAQATFSFSPSLYNGMTNGSYSVYLTDYNGNVMNIISLLGCEINTNQFDSVCFASLNIKKATITQITDLNGLDKIAGLDSIFIHNCSNTIFMNNLSVTYLYLSNIDSIVTQNTTINLLRAQNADINLINTSIKQIEANGNSLFWDVGSKINRISAQYKYIPTIISNMDSLKYVDIGGIQNNSLSFSNNKGLDTVFLRTDYLMNLAIQGCPLLGFGFGPSYTNGGMYNKCDIYLDSVMTEYIEPMSFGINMNNLQIVNSHHFRKIDFSWWGGGMLFMLSNFIFK